MLKKTYLEKDALARISILSGKEFISQAQDFVIGYAKYFNFSEKELSHIELIVEEALLSTIDNSFPREIGSIDITVSYNPGKFIVSIQDKGMPVDMKMLESSENSYMSVLLMKNLADEFNFVNLGKGGKRFELIKYIKDKNISDIIKDEKISETAEELTPAEDIPEIRLIEANEVTMLSRLAFKSYGYTYISDFYYPDKIKELIERELLVSAVCINAKKEIVGTLNLLFDKKDDKVADCGAAMVDPRYRGHNLFKRMKVFLSDYANNHGLYGLYSEAVTIHPFTQSGNISLGAKETGIMLAYVKEIITFKKISYETSEQRQAVVLYYLSTNKEPFRKVYINSKFFDIINKIYSNLEFDREIIKVETEKQILPEPEITLFSTSVKSDLNIAIIKIEVIGKDVIGIIKAQLKQFCLKKIETIYLEIPLSEPYSAVIISKANDLGFLLSGIVPEFCEGDIIKMQYLNNVFVDADKISLAGDLAKEILDCIMKDYL